MTDAARSRREPDRYEPRIAGPDQGVGGADPLAELARLVGQDDPYRQLFQHTPDHHADASAHRSEEDQTAWAEDRWHPHDHDPAYDQVHGDSAHLDPSLDPAASHHHGQGRGAVHHGYDERPYAHDLGAYRDEAGMADEHFAPDDASAAGTLPDLWAQGEDAPHDPYVAPDHAAVPSRDVADRAAARRPVAVLAAVLLLTGGGLAATFLARGSAATGTASSARAAPTIMAATGPSKVKVDDPAASAPEDRDAALLSKNGSAPVGPAKIVSHEEQPVDLGQLPKAGDLAEGAHPLPQAAPSPFPEPKKVKTFLVHPDGSMLAADGAPPPQLPATAAPPAPSGPAADAAPAPLAATPQTPAAGATTPPTTTVASLLADLSANDAAPTPVRPQRQAPSRGVHAPSPKPSDAAETPSGGGFGLQLAASPTEADATAAFAKLKKRFPAQLGSYSATIHKSDTGDKPVYRVRVGGLGQDEARSLCGKLQSAGGSCFVVHN